MALASALEEQEEAIHKLYSLGNLEYPKSPTHAMSLDNENQG